MRAAATDATGSFFFYSFKNRWTRSYQAERRIKKNWAAFSRVYKEEEHGDRDVVRIATVVYIENRFFPPFFWLPVEYQNSQVDIRTGMAAGVRLMVYRETLKACGRNLIWHLPSYVKEMAPFWRCYPAYKYIVASFFFFFRFF